VWDADSETFLGDVVEDGQTLRVARGGRGGKGNLSFATSTNRAPREWEPGGEGEMRSIELVLKLIADVGLVGQPNAGKSTLLSVVSAAKPKIADYPFTTLEPNLGVVGLSESRSFVVADIPGIIEGAHEGKGLGSKFLQHIERNRVLVFMVPADCLDPEEEYHQLRNEVREYSDDLYGKPHLVVVSKMDLWLPDEPDPSVAAPEALAVHHVSSATGAGITELKEAMWHAVQDARKEELNGVPSQVPMDD
jgi:GTP-binding protein